MLYGNGWAASTEGGMSMECKACGVWFASTMKTDLCTTCERAMKRLGFGNFSYDRLRELAQADREGRCVVLPCKLHDKVFFIENGCVKETEVDSFHNWTSGRWKISTHTDRMYEHWKGYEIDFSGIGKTVFLSREDAEKAVEMEENRNG